MQLTSADILNLILIGKSDTNPDSGLLTYFRKRDFVNRQLGQSWRAIVAVISDNELLLIFKGLVTLEREIKWMGGSAAGAIWVYDVIRQRGLDKDYSIADYGFKNCDNPYIPFGNSYHGIRKVEDYFSFQAEKSRVKSERAIIYEKVLKRGKGRKEKRIAEIAALRKLSKEQRGQIRNDLLLKHSSSSTLEKLQLMAADKIYPPEYYPIEWIVIPTSEIEKLPQELIKKLYDKLSTKTKGHWKRFSAQLQKFDDGT